MYINEKDAVDKLGRMIGFGRMMQLAQECWREKLKEDGYPTGGEFTCREFNLVKSIISDVICEIIAEENTKISKTVLDMRSNKYARRILEDLGLPEDECGHDYKETRMGTFGVKLSVGKEYDLLDGCGMVIQKGKFLGPAYPVYVDHDGDRVDTSTVGMLVFDLGEHDGHYRYAGVQRPEVRLVENGLQIELMTTYYGHSVETLRLAAEPARPASWRLAHRMKL